MPESWTTLIIDVAEGIERAMGGFTPEVRHFSLGTAYGAYKAMKYEEQMVFGNKYPNLKAIVTNPYSPEASRAKTGAVDEIKKILKR